LKGNQGTLHQGVIDYIDEQFENDFANVAARRLTTTEKHCHGRICVCDIARTLSATI
jgi:hypothetical protein